jgi:hypothetical protein
MALPSRDKRPLESTPNGSSSLHRLGMLDLLKQDPRPTFIIDTSPDDPNTGNGCPLEYWNSAMAAADPGGLLRLLRRDGGAYSTSEKGYAPFTHFRSWSSKQNTTDESFLYHGFNWTRIHVAGRWNVISGLLAATCATNEGMVMAPLARKTSKSKVPNFDWTDELPPLRLSPHAAWARSIDWASTPLGPMSSWSSQLRSIANLVMQDPRPAVVFYGPDLIMIYNEAEIELLGGFHPCMGVSARVALASVWGEYFEPIIQTNLAGSTVEKTNTAIHMVRNGFMEETYFSLKFIPILDAEGITIGHYEPLVETVRSQICKLIAQFVACYSKKNSDNTCGCGQHLCNPRVPRIRAITTNKPIYSIGNPFVYSLTDV